MREKDFEMQIREFLKEHGCWVVKYFGNSFSQNGVPDLLCCIAGRFVAVEVKAEGGRPTRLQEVTVQKIRDAGGMAMILYPEQFGSFKNMVLGLLRTTEKG